MSADLSAFALYRGTLHPLPPAPGAATVNEAFDHLPLGIYEGLRTFGDARFIGLEAHIDRAAFGLRHLSWDPELLQRRALHEALTALARSHSHADVVLRFDILAAPTGDPPARLVIARAPLKIPAPGVLAEGVCVHPQPGLVRVDPLLKSAEFVLQRRPHPRRVQDDWDRLLLGPDGEVLEGTSSSFFGVLEGTLATAPLPSVLDGVTRGVLLQLASALGIPIRQEAVTRDELPRLDEAFLSGSVGGVTPVVRIGDRPVGAGRPGPLTQDLVRDYADFTAG